MKTTDVLCAFGDQLVDTVASCRSIPDRPVLDTAWYPGPVLFRSTPIRQIH